MTARRRHEQTLAWLRDGTEVFQREVGGIDDAGLDRPSALPDWTRRHLLAHLAGNAEALGRLTDWAHTGEENPMYSSPQQRAADIESGSQLEPARLRDWVSSSAETLQQQLGELTEDQWQREVRTAQGRLVPATEIPWLRSREVQLHSVDLDTGVTVEQLPHDFLLALIDDIVGKRTAAGADPALTLRASDTDDEWQIPGDGEPVTVSGSVPALAGWLSGRTDSGLQTEPGALPGLTPWL